MPRGGLKAQEAEQGEEFLWMLYDQRMDRVTLGFSLLPKCWGPYTEGPSLKVMLIWIFRNPWVFNLSRVQKVKLN